eukprot:TRINITY_DN3391_c0_g1_i5.p2 TRINITY_DN3391_c0_g1~~TRINITY_DN3391_c0_g1_i5.p2  ORF type:complete len:803 (-),score=114.26 TRINITY_DN3391_c0_g1_i5:100-2508(-)
MRNFYQKMTMQYLNSIKYIKDIISKIKHLMLYLLKSRIKLKKHSNSLSGHHLKGMTQNSRKLQGSQKISNTVTIASQILAIIFKKIYCKNQLECQKSKPVSTSYRTGLLTWIMSWNQMLFMIICSKLNRTIMYFISYCNLWTYTIYLKKSEQIQVILTHFLIIKQMPIMKRLKSKDLNGRMHMQCRMNPRSQLIMLGQLTQTISFVLERQYGRRGNQKRFNLRVYKMKIQPSRKELKNLQILRGMEQYNFTEEELEIMAQRERELENLKFKEDLIEKKEQLYHRHRKYRKGFSKYYIGLKERKTYYRGTEPIEHGNKAKFQEKVNQKTKKELKRQKQRIKDQIKRKEIQEEKKYEEEAKKEYMKPERVAQRLQDQKDVKEEYERERLADIQEFYRDPVFDSADEWEKELRNYDLNDPMSILKLKKENYEIYFTQLEAQNDLLNEHIQSIPGGLKDQQKYQLKELITDKQLEDLLDELQQFIDEAVVQTGTEILKYREIQFKMPVLDLSTEQPIDVGQIYDSKEREIAEKKNQRFKEKKDFEHHIKQEMLQKGLKKKKKDEHKQTSTQEDTIKEEEPVLDKNKQDLEEQKQEKDEKAIKSEPETQKELPPEKSEEVKNIEEQKGGNKGMNEGKLNWIDLCDSDDDDFSVQDIDTLKEKMKQKANEQLKELEEEEKKKPSQKQKLSSSIQGKGEQSQISKDPKTKAREIYGKVVGSQMPVPLKKTAKGKQGNLRDQMLAAQLSITQDDFIEVLDPKQKKRKKKKKEPPANKQSSKERQAQDKRKDKAQVMKQQGTVTRVIKKPP